MDFDGGEIDTAPKGFHGKAGPGGLPPIGTNWCEAEDTDEDEEEDDVEEIVIAGKVVRFDSNFVPTFDNILDQYMKGYGTVKNYQRTYGG